MDSENDKVPESLEQRLAEIGLHNEGNLVMDDKNRVLVAFKKKGPVIARYPDMTDLQKKFIMGMLIAISSPGSKVVDFKGEPVDKASLEDFLNFKDGKKGDLCG